jgi:Arc/MetJ-type ribon-helix-helix transcriptional regulator
MKTISLRLPDKIIEEIDHLVEQGLYASRTEALREGARILLRAQTGSIPGRPAEVTKDEIWRDFSSEKKLK